MRRSNIQGIQRVSEEPKRTDAARVRCALGRGQGLRCCCRERPMRRTLSEQDVEVTTPDGVADCYLRASGRPAAHPGVVIWPDILGLRPAFRQMGRRLAESGYSVLVVNPFYRSARAPVVP